MFFIADVDNVTFNNNLYKNIATNFDYWLNIGTFNTNIVFSENMTVNTSNKPVYPFGQLSSTSTNNEYYQSLPGQINDASDIIHTTDPTLNYQDFVFTTDRYTVNPRVITIPKVLDINQAPTATNVLINGIAEQGLTLTLSYNYADPEGDSEGETIIAWSTPTEELQRGTSTQFIIPEGYCEDTIGAWVHPIDSYGNTPTYGIPASNNMLTITCNASSVNETTLENLIVFPNPVKNILSIKTNNTFFKDYFIFNTLGQNIFSGIISNNTIDVSKIQKGVYFIHLKNKINTKIIKIIKIIKK